MLRGAVFGGPGGLGAAEVVGVGVRGMGGGGAGGRDAEAVRAGLAPRGVWELLQAVWGDRGAAGGVRPWVVEGAAAGVERVAVAEVERVAVAGVERVTVAGVAAAVAGVERVAVAGVERAVVAGVEAVISGRVGGLLDVVDCLIWFIG